MKLNRVPNKKRMIDGMYTRNKKISEGSLYKLILTFYRHLKHAIKLDTRKNATLILFKNNRNDNNKLVVCT